MAGDRTRSTAGRSMPAAARSSTRWRRGWNCRKARSFASRDVLARYGNMSSSTLMFVLALLMERPDVGQAASPSPSGRGSPRRASISSGLHDVARRPLPPGGADGRSGARLRKPMHAVLRDLARVNRWTLRRRGTTLLSSSAQARGMLAFRLLDVGFGHGDMLRRDRALGAAARHRRRSGRRRPQSEQRGGGARGDARRTADRISHRRLCDAADAVRFRRLEPRRPSYERRSAPRLPALHGRTQREPRLVDQRPAPPRLRLSRLSAARPAHGLAPHRPRGRAVVDRARLSPRRVARDPRRRRRPEGAARIVRRFPFRLCVERLR